MKTAARVLILGAAAYFLIAFIALVLVRYDNPGHNGPYEDGSAELAVRALEGKPVYTAASVEYIPMIYGPALPYLGAVSMSVFGKNLPALRLVSILAVVGIAFTLFALLRVLMPRDSAVTRLQAWLFALGLFLAMYVVSHTWLDLAKVDSLFVLAIALNILLVLNIVARDKGDFVGAGALALNTQLLMFSKQSGLLFIISNVLLLLIYKKFRALAIYVFTAGLIWAILALLLENQAGSEFLRYNFTIPGLHPLIQHKTIFPGQITAQSELLKRFWPQMLLLIIMVAAMFHALGADPSRGKIAMLTDFAGRVIANRPFFVLGSMVFTAFLVSLLGRLKLGGYVNSWLYFHFVAVLFIAWWIANAPWEKWNGRFRMALGALVALLVLLQFGALRYNVVTEYRASKASKTTARQYAKAYCAIGQPVMNLMNSYQGPLFCGTRGSFLWQSAIDIMFHEKEFAGLYESLRGSILKKEYRNIIFPYAYDENMLGQFKSLLKSQMLMSKKEDEKRKIERLLLTIRIYEIIKSRYRVVKPENFSKEEKFVMTTLMKDNPQVILMKPIGK